MKVLSTLLLSGAFGVASCHSESACPAPQLLVVHVWTLDVTARDSVSGALLANTTAIAARTPQGDTATRSIGSDVSQYPVTLNVFGGTYTVSVAAPGYLTWSKTVTTDPECRINHVQITALMQKSP